MDTEPKIQQEARESDQAPDAEVATPRPEASQPNSALEEADCVKQDTLVTRAERASPTDGLQVGLTRNGDQQPPQDQQAAVAALDYSFERPVPLYQGAGTGQFGTVPVAPGLELSWQHRIDQMGSWFIQMPPDLTNWQGQQVSSYAEPIPVGIDQGAGMVQPDGSPNAVGAEPRMQLPEGQDAPEFTTHVDLPTTSQPSGLYLQTGELTRASEARRVATDLWVEWQAANLPVRRRIRRRRPHTYNLRSRAAANRRRQEIAARIARQNAMARRHSRDTLHMGRQRLRQQYERRQVQSSRTFRDSPSAVDSAPVNLTAPGAGQVQLIRQQPQGQIGSGTRDAPIVLNDSCSSSSPSRESDMFTVEAIRDIRSNPTTGMKEWLVKWKNYPETENTWEPTANLNCPDIVDEFETRRRSELREKLTQAKERLEALLAMTDKVLKRLEGLDQ